MFKKSIILFTLLLTLSGCANISGEQVLYDTSQSIEQAIKNADWTQIQALSDEFKKLYAHNEWKIQLLGDEGEYEGLQQSIGHLFVAIGEQDIMETKRELSTIQTYLDLIYSL